MSKELECCQRLRELEDAITAQRQFIAQLKSQNLDIDGERERLTELLGELDQELQASRALTPVRTSTLQTRVRMERVA